MSVPNSRAARIAWTRRQREVLDLLTRGMTNAQIADRLGISLDGAKWHVSEIITRLGVESRDEAAEYWRAENGLRLRFSRALRAMWPSALWVRVAAVAAVLAVGAGVAAIILALGGEDEARPASPTPSVAATELSTATVETTPTASVTPDIIDGITARPLTLGAPTTLPAGVLLYYYVVGYAVDGGPGGAQWIFRSASGTLIRGTMPSPPGGTVYSSTGSNLTQEYYAAVCTVGTCGGIQDPSPDSQDQVFHSSDGGFTWDVVGTLPRGAYFAAFTSKGPVISTQPGGRGTPHQFALYPGGAVLTPPVAGASLVQLSDGAPAWVDDAGGRFFSEDGAKLLWTSPQLGGARAYVPGRSGQAFVEWSGAVGRAYVESPYSNYIAILDTGSAISTLFSFPGKFDIRINAVLSTTLLVGNVPLDASAELTDGIPAHFEPAIFDLSTGLVHPLPEIAADLPGYSNGSNLHAFVSAVVLGSFARVTTGTDCLNVRKSASTSAPSLGCFKDGVLLRIRNDASETAGWVAVNTPDGRLGFASSEFLQR